MPGVGDVSRGLWRIVVDVQIACGLVATSNKVDETEAKEKSIERNPCDLISQ